MAEAKIDVVIGAKTEAFGSGMQKAMGTLGKFIALGTAVRFGLQILKTADDLEELSVRTQVSTNALQEWKFAAEQSGAALDDFTQAIKFVAKAQIDALEGSEDLQRTFARFGLTLEHLRRLNREQVLRIVAEGVRKLGATSQVMDDLLKVMGRGADRLIPTFITGLESLSEQARSTGQVMDEELIKKLAQANDQLDAMKSKATVLGAPLVKELVEDLAQAYAGGGKLVTFLKEFFAQGKSWNQAWKDANKFADDIARTVMGSGPPAGRAKPAPSSGADSIWKRIGDPGEIKSWTATTVGPEKATRELVLPAADALARIGGMRGGADTGMRILNHQLQRLVAIELELKKLNREVTAE